MSLAAASRDPGRRRVYCYQASRKLKASVDKPVSALAKFGASPNLRNIVLHVLGRPATTVSDKRKLGKGEAKLSKEHQHLADHRLDIVLPAYHDEAGDLVADQHAIMDRDLVLNAIQPFCHLDVERTRTTPTDGRRDQHDISPEDQRLIDRVELIGGIHLRDRAGVQAWALFE